MLRFAFRRGGDRVSSVPATGRGWVEPLDHPAVETFVFRSTDCTAILARERMGGSAAREVKGQIRVDYPALTALRRIVRDWPLDWVWLEVDHSHQGVNVSCESGFRPTVPLFLCASDDWLLGDWEPLNLYPAARPAGLDREIAAHFLATFDQPYSRDTVFTGIKRLTAGATAIWPTPNGQLEIRYPEPALHDYPRELKAEADPVASFESIFDAEMHRHFGDQAGRVAVQLSGGLDSAVVAGLAVQRADSAMSYGALLPGVDGAAQRARRDEIIARFGLEDHSIEGNAALPLDPTGVRLTERRFVPWEESYYELFDRLLGRARVDGHWMMLTGLGGDEVIERYWQELPESERVARTTLKVEALPKFLPAALRATCQDRAARVDRAPPAYAQRSMLSAVSNAAAQSLRHGLWPVHPFAAPELVRYGHALPIEWRANRRLIRTLLGRWGLSPQVTHSATTEDFTELLRSAMMRDCRTVFDRFLAAERLADLGLVEPRALCETFTEWCVGRAPAEWDAHFLAAAILEASLWAMEGEFTSAFPLSQLSGICSWSPVIILPTRAAEALV